MLSLCDKWVSSAGDSGMVPSMTFAERLKELRLRAGMTQAALAQASGLGLPTIHHYEQGKREPSLRSAVKLAEALGVAVQEFVDSVKGEEEQPPPAIRGRPGKTPPAPPPPPSGPSSSRSEPAPADEEKSPPQAKGKGAGKPRRKGE